MKQFNNLTISHKGFTLIEILIVVAIIGILASVTLVGLGPLQKRGRDARRLSDLRQAQAALELYYSKCGYYPGDAEANTPCAGFDTAPGSWDALEAVIVDTDLGIKNLPNDPRGGSTYFYASADGSSYTIAAQLEDKDNSVMSQSADSEEENGITAEGTCGEEGLYCIEF